VSGKDIMLLTDEVLSERQKRRLLDGDFLRVAVIGCGTIFAIRTHPSLYGLPVEVVALCDVQETRARQYANAFGVSHVFTDYSRMLSELELDGVIVAAGSKLHPRIAVDVMEAGLPVLTEKPPAMSAEGTAQMLEASRRTGQICMTAFMKRFAPIYQQARAEVESAEFGTPSLLAMNWYCPTWFTEEPDNPNTWFLLDFGIHAVDLCRYLFGDVAEVYARGNDGAAYAITLAFANGAVGNLSLSGRREARLVEQVELTGGPGQSVTITDTRELTRFADTQVTAWHHNAFTITDSIHDTGFRGEIAEFLAAIEEGREPRSAVQSAHETMRLFDAIKDSLESGGVVSLAEER
jgi:myo-inositol 2-dehydrogenase / D-chiro-inositol 1-dehydrogenase